MSLIPTNKQPPELKKMSLPSKFLIEQRLPTEIRGRLWGQADFRFFITLGCLVGRQKVPSLYLKKNKDKDEFRAHQTLSGKQKQNRSIKKFLHGYFFKTSALEISVVNLGRKIKIFICSSVGKYREQVFFILPMIN